MQAVLHGGAAGAPAGIGPQPSIDSLVVVEVLLELETQFFLSCRRVWSRQADMTAWTRSSRTSCRNYRSWSEYHKEKI